VKFSRERERDGGRGRGRESYFTNNLLIEEVSEKASGGQ